MLNTKGSFTVYDIPASLLNIAAVVSKNKRNKLSLNACKLPDLAIRPTAVR